MTPAQPHSRTGPPRRPRPAAQEAQTARRTALDALIAIDGGARANLVVPELLARSRLDERDRGLVTELAYGACRMQRACDWLTDRYVRGRVDTEVRAALRLGAYQLGWTRIPPHAAVAATVEEVRGRGRPVVNAILRRVASSLSAGLVTWPDRATELSYPDWIVDRLTADLGRDRAFGALTAMNEPAAATVRPDGYIQDRASQLVAEHLGGYEPATVLDLCAAPGGKSTGLAARAGFVVASDLSRSRAYTIAENVRRLGTANVATVVGDGTVPPYRHAAFDLVLVDAPCTGLGVLRRRPDARWRLQPANVDRLVDLQQRLLRSAAEMVRPGGVLAYSVCTLTAAETAGIDNWLAESFPGLVPLPPPGGPWRPAGRGALLLPQDAGTDGMFLLSLRSRAT